MIQQDQSSRRPGLWTALAASAAVGATVITIALPPMEAAADPVPPSTTTAAPAAPASSTPAPATASPVPADPNATVPPPADPNAPANPAPAPVEPNAPAAEPADPNAPAAVAPAPAPEPGRVNNAAGGFSYLLPAGWEVADASRLSYGQALLLKQTGPAQPGQTAPTANDTSILLGRLDLKLFAGAEPDNAKAAVRLASDMGEFFMPFPGTRINQQSTVLQAADLPGSAASYDVKFTDTTKPNGQIWAGVVGVAGNPQSHATGSRWFVVWLGTAKDPVDAVAAKALASSIRPYTAPAAPAPDPNAPPAPAPAPGNRVGIPIPVETPVPEMMPGG